MTCEENSKYLKIAAVNKKQRNDKKFLPPKLANLENKKVIFCLFVVIVYSSVVPVNPLEKKQNKTKTTTTTTTNQIILLAPEGTTTVH